MVRGVWGNWLRPTKEDVVPLESYFFSFRFVPPTSAERVASRARDGTPETLRARGRRDDGARGDVARRRRGRGVRPRRRGRGAESRRARVADRS